MRLFSQFAHLAAKGEDIELHTDGESARQYIHIEDALDAILCVLYKGKPGEAYNAANEDTYISAKDLAYFIQERFNPSGAVVFRSRNDMGYAPTTKIKLDTSKLRSLGWQPKHDLNDMFGNLIMRLKK
jgi:nucleoside-diphosphate-sugar epimerase